MADEMGMNEPNDVFALYDQIKKLRQETGKCSKHLLDVIADEKLFDGDLLDHLAETSNDLKNAQAKLLFTLAGMGMKPPASMSEIGNFLVSWKKAQEEKAEAASLSDILKDVLALSYKGEDRKIAEELEKIRKEAAAILGDMDHFKNHKDRILAMKKLLSAAAPEGPSLDLFNEICRSFSTTIGYALMQHLILRREKENAGEKTETERAAAVDKTPRETHPSEEKPVPATEKQKQIPAEAVENVKKEEASKAEDLLEKKELRPKLKKATKFISTFRDMKGLGVTAKILLRELQVKALILPDWYVGDPGIDPASPFRALVPEALERLYDSGCIARLTGGSDEAYVINPELWPVLHQDSVNKWFFKKNSKVSLNEPSDYYHCFKDFQVMKGVYFVRENLSKSHHIYYGREGIGDVHGFLTMEGKDEKGILNLLFIDSVNSKKLTDEIMKEVKAGKAKGGNVEQEKSSGEKTEPPLVLVVMISSADEISEWTDRAVDMGFERFYFLETGPEARHYRLMDREGKEQPFQVLYFLTGPSGPDEHDKTGLPEEHSSSEAGEKDVSKNPENRPSEKKSENSADPEIEEKEEKPIPQADEHGEQRTMGKEENRPVNDTVLKMEEPQKTDNRTSHETRQQEDRVVQKSEPATVKAQADAVTAGTEKEKENRGIPFSSAVRVIPPEEAIELTASQMKAHHWAEAMLLIHSLRQANEREWIRDLEAELSYALVDPLYSRISEGRDSFDYWDSSLDVPEVDAGSARDYLNSAALLRAFYHPDRRNENWRWQSENHIRQINDDRDNEALQKLPSLKKVLNLLAAFLRRNERGLGNCLADTDDSMDRLRQDLEEYGKEINEQNKKIENNRRKMHNHPRLQKTYDVMFGKNSDCRRCYDAFNRKDYKPLLDFCSRFMDGPISGCLGMEPEQFSQHMDPHKISDYIDSLWNGVHVDRQNNSRLIGIGREKIMNLLTDTVECFGKYALAMERLEQMGASAPVDMYMVRKQAEQVESTCTDLMGEMESLSSENPMEEIGIAALRYLVKSLIKETHSANDGRGEETAPGYKKQRPFYAPFLLTTFIELDSHFLPFLFDFRIPALDLYDRVRKHIEKITAENLVPSSDEAWETAEKQALRERDMGSARLISVLSGKPAFEGLSEEEIQVSGEAYLKEQLSDFRSSLELAYNYGQITEKNRMDFYMETANRLAKHLKETENYGFIGLFKRACMDKIRQDSAPRRASLENQFRTLRKKLLQNGGKEDDFPVLGQIKKCLSENNLSVAEDYMRQCQDGKRTEISQMVVSYPNEFMKFLKPKNYNPLYDMCAKNGKYMLNSIFDNWLRSNNTSNSQLSKNSAGREKLDFVNSWVRLISNGTVGLSNLIYHLGYPRPLDDIQREKRENNRFIYHLRFDRSESSGESQTNRHPIKAFGSGIFEHGLRVISISGRRTWEEIINEIQDCGIQPETGTICIFDGAMALSERRELARAMKVDDNMRNIIVIDRVLALYLTDYERLNRRNKTIELAMPFGNAQPFISTGFIPPEMFIGRTAELAKIRDMNGPTLVYGGRQLGKSILLKQVSLLEHHPEKDMYAFYFDIKGKDMEAALHAIAGELSRNGLIMTEPETWEDFGEQMKDLLTGRFQKKVSKLMLLIDEADQFLLSADREKNKPIEVLRDIRNYSENRFKFVLAGLHNVIRFDKNRLGSNTVYGQLEHINIKPFSFSDACELLLKPLSYMGFEIPSMEIISTILSKTNYFPGLIQFYGKKLVESVKESYRKKDFNTANNPPYVLDEKYLKTLLEDKDFLEDIEKKFQITLRVDEGDDDYYYLIALAMADCYALEDGQPKQNYKPDDIRNVAVVYGISRLTNLSLENLEALMDEMEELNIFRKDEEGGYLFNRYSFYSMMGGTEKIERELENYADE